MKPTGLVDVIPRLEDVFDGLGLRRSYRGAIACNPGVLRRPRRDLRPVAPVPPQDIKAILLAQHGHLDLDRIRLEARDPPVRGELGGTRGASRRGRLNTCPETGPRDHLDLLRAHPRYVAIASGLAHEILDAAP